MAILHRSSASLSVSSSTTHLLGVGEHPNQKDYEAAFGSLVDAYGFGTPLPLPLPLSSPPLGGTSPPPPSPVHTTRPSAPLPRQPTSCETRAGAGSLYTRLLALLKQRRDATKRLARRSAPDLRSPTLPSSARKSAAQDSDGVQRQRARGYEAAFIALQVEHGFIIGSSLSSAGSRAKKT